MTQRAILDFYSAPGEMTVIPEPAAEIKALPDELSELVRCVQGLLLHQQWASAYDVALSADRNEEPHLRSVAQMLHRLRARDRRPLSVARTLDARLVCICRHFSVLLVALLRAKGVPARARCGFGTYFERDKFVDHWVGEYWNGNQARWILVDAQLDELQRHKIRADFDPLDVPRDRFLVAGDGWARCRSSAADPAAFGIFGLRGLWFVAGNLLHDLAALNNKEMLPWDVWGAMVREGEPIAADRLALFDRIAALTRTPDSGFAALRALYKEDPRLSVPPVVFNALRQRPEPVFTD